MCYNFEMQFPPYEKNKSIAIMMYQCLYLYYELLVTVWALRI